MWENGGLNLRSKGESKLFLRWLQEDVLTDNRKNQARKILVEAGLLAPELQKFDHTPQSAPWHCEGIFVRFHIERMLAGLLGILEGQSLLSVEELVGEKYWREDILKLEETIRANAATVQAFILLHDIAKPATISFDAAVSSKGAIEGFAQHKRRLNVAASPAEQALYFKLFRAFELAEGAGSSRPLLRRDSSRPVAHSVPEGDSVMAFFTEYGIETHYLGHARRALKPEYRAARTAIETSLHLEPRDAELLAFAMENHIDVLDFFGTGPDVSKFELLIARANKMKLDANEALDILLACVFLDSAIGSLSCKDGKFGVDLVSTFNFWRSEELAAPARRAKRREEIRLAQKKEFKTLLKSAGLSSDEVFQLTKIPFGRGRKELVEAVDELVKNPALPIPASLQNKEVLKRLAKAQKLFDANRNTWENGGL